MDEVKNSLLKQIPSVNDILETSFIKNLLAKFPRNSVVQAIRTAVDELRAAIKNSKEKQSGNIDISIQALAERTVRIIEKAEQPNLRRVINATGIILHTGLGRAVLSKKAREALSEITRGYSSLEMNLETGERGRRDSNVHDLLCQLTGAESATVVNNNAAATMIILKTLAQGKEVIVSRGQLIEIGGSYRIPDVMRESGAKLVEVGTTNKTHLRDYKNAITPDTALLLHVHQSNYRIIGFTRQVPIEELVPLGKEHGIPVVDDLGSGALLDYTQYGIAPEPMVQASIKAGADAVCFSGDKLLGGPQAGIILGKKEIIERIRKNPLARAVRVGKLTMATLEATLRLFRNPETLMKEHAVLRMLSMTKDEIFSRAKKLVKQLIKTTGERARIEIIEGFSQMGGGSMPGENIPTFLISVKGKGISLDDAAKFLRLGEPSVVCRIQRDALLFDIRTVQEDEDAELVAAISRIPFTIRAC